MKTIFSSVIWIANILFWRHLEENQPHAYPAYVVYKQKTWF
jgi:hypothetical protein